MAKKSSPSDASYIHDIASVTPALPGEAPSQLWKRRVEKAFQESRLEDAAEGVEERYPETLKTPEATAKEAERDFFTDLSHTLAEALYKDSSDAAQEISRRVQTPNVLRSIIQNSLIRGLFQDLTRNETSPGYGDYNYTNEYDAWKRANATDNTTSKITSLNNLSLRLLPYVKEQLSLMLEQAKSGLSQEVKEQAPEAMVKNVAERLERNGISQAQLEEKGMDIQILLLEEANHALRAAQDAVIEKRLVFWAAPVQDYDMADHQKRVAESLCGSLADEPFSAERFQRLTKTVTQNLANLFQTPATTPIFAHTGKKSVLADEIRRIFTQGGDYRIVRWTGKDKETGRTKHTAFIALQSAGEETPSSETMEALRAVLEKYYPDKFRLQTAKLPNDTRHSLCVLAKTHALKEQYQSMTALAIQLEVAGLTDKTPADAFKWQQKSSSESKEHTPSGSDTRIMGRPNR